MDEGLLSGLTNIANGGLDYDVVPRAYINYILFDKNYQVIEGKKLQISQAGKFEIGDTDLGPHEHLVINPITIDKEGYIYIYLSNQTPGSDVYIPAHRRASQSQAGGDDLMITHTQSRVIQKDDYYPFGLTFNTSKREGSLTNKFTFQGQELQDDFDLNWYSFKWRNHMPEIGRFFNVDPLADKYVHNSPYSFSENKVVAHIELEGLESIRMINPLVRLHKGMFEYFNQPDKALKIVKSNSEYINNSAEKIGVSAQSIGSIVFQEKAAGWRGDLSNIVAEVVKDNNTLSLGLGEMQVGLAAELMGMDPESLTDDQRQMVKDALNDPEKSIELIGLNIKDMEEFVGRELTVEEATYGHNVGKEILKKKIDQDGETINRVSNRSISYQEEISDAINNN